DQSTGACTLLSPTPDGKQLAPAMLFHQLPSHAGTENSLFRPRDFHRDTSRCRAVQPSSEAVLRVYQSRLLAQKPSLRMKPLARTVRSSSSARRRWHRAQQTRLEQGSDFRRSACLSSGGPETSPPRKPRTEPRNRRVRSGFLSAWMARPSELPLRK